MANPQSLNRFSYVGNRPLIFIDPSGNIPLDCTEIRSGYAYCGAKPKDLKQASFPTGQCDADCFDAFRTYHAIVVELGREPDFDEVLHMTMGAEYYGVTGLSRGVGPTGAEGIARNLYEQCNGTSNCTPTEMYQFLAAYQPWFGAPGRIDGSPFQRARHLITTLNNDFLFTGRDINNDINIILNPLDPTWALGLDYNKPWNWYGGFIPNPDNSSRATFGYGPNNSAILQVEFGNGCVFWMFTYVQDQNFKANFSYWVQETC